MSDGRFLIRSACSSYACQKNAISRSALGFVGRERLHQVGSYFLPERLRREDFGFGTEAVAVGRERGALDAVEGEDADLAPELVPRGEVPVSPMTFSAK